MNEKDKAQVCSNCKYFQRYYVISCGFRFKPTTKGYCGNGKVNCNAAKKLVRADAGCDLWQSEELRKLSGGYCVESALDKSAELLEEIRDYLRDGERR